MMLRAFILALAHRRRPAAGDGFWRRPRRRRHVTAQRRCRRQGRLGGIDGGRAPAASPANADRSRASRTSPQLQSARDNQLVGYGLVIGLQGTGDSLRNSPFTEQSIRAMLENLGIATEGGRARAKNVAAVIVTANLPPFVQSGARIDVNVSSLGDATSLAGGTLVMTPLKAADGEIYAVAQGLGLRLRLHRRRARPRQLTQGVPTAGRVPNGAIVERAGAGRIRRPRHV